MREAFANSNQPNPDDEEEGTNAVVTTLDTHRLSVHTLAPLANADNDTSTSYDTTVRFIPDDNLIKKLKKASVDVTTSNFSDTYYDTPRLFILTKKNLWLRKRNDSFILYYPVISEEEDHTLTTIKTERRYFKIKEIIREHTDIKLHPIAYDASHHDFERILGQQKIIPHAEIRTSRTSYSFSVTVGHNFLPRVNNANKHRVKIHVDKATLKDPPSIHKSQSLQAFRL
jgi:hypothetical protein